jgi:hypothetical protein
MTAVEIIKEIENLSDAEKDSLDLFLDHELANELRRRLGEDHSNSIDEQDLFGP